MKKIILFSLLVLCANNLFGQTNGGNNGQTPPTYQNPYRNEVTPFVNDNNGRTKIFDDNKKTDDQGDKKNTRNNANKQTGDRENNILDLRDRNSSDIYKSDAELRAKYKDDPDYLKYIGINPENNGFDDRGVSELNKDTADQVYGADFLSSESNFANYSNNSSMTTVPEDYRLGVGDEIGVAVWGSSELEQSYTISKDGSIFPNQVGKIILQGLSFQKARSIIRSRFLRILPTGSNVDIVLGKVRTIRVYVNGEVKRSGMITISALNTPINALQMAGGLTKYGNLRDIEIRRNGVVIEHLDIYEYLRTGNQGRGIYLEDNDVIAVKMYDKIVTAKGAFKRPMRYQLNRYEALSDLIELAGGAMFDARKSLIRVKTVYKEKQQYIDIPGNNFQDYVLMDGDEVSINPINEGVSNIVTIEGAVAYPDEYQIKPEMRVFDLIEQAGGLNPNSYKTRAFIFRNGFTADKSIAKKVDLTDYGNANSPENILLENGDLIRILSETQFDQKFFVEVKGLVREPGEIPYKPNLVLKDLLLMAGGLQLDAESGRIEISNVTDTFSRYSISGHNVRIRTVSISPNLEIDEASEKIGIKPYDIIYVRKKKDIVEQQNVMIYGEVDYPGPYALLSNQEKITSLLNRTGGLSKEAFPDGAKLYRKDIGPVVINLKDAIRHKGGKDDIILEDGDSIIIPKHQDIVKVQGEVQMPINIKYDRENQNVMNYIDAAGGFGERPWRKRISVRYQNGRLKRTKSFLFFKFYPKVKPGSFVMVPKQPERDKVDIKEIVQYSLTSLTSIFTVYILSKNLK